MGLPGWTDEGLLPAGCWQATMDEVHERLVLDTRHPHARATVFHGLAAYAGEIREYLSAGRIQLDGRFVSRDGTTRAADGPALIVTVFPSNLAELELLSAEEIIRMNRLFSKTDVIADDEGHCEPVFTELHPVGNHIAAYLVVDEDEDLWDSGRIATHPALAERGVVELAW
ncbi:DUF6932 family protein [Nocardia terpenica]|uniref:Uncharacterized protein n=1 Tax=Nocardia terpenica TaxID=455432 RepID=A0A291RCR2_9NOCA|nr:hypothetical protein [Nocardia terpenica]ATL65110.1 hypothetical protein CRH09_01560 [Nocardia terpenica]